MNNADFLVDISLIDSIRLAPTFNPAGTDKWENGELCDEDEAT